MTTLLTHSQVVNDSIVKPVISFNIAELNDGPYIFIEDNKLIEKFIKNGEINQKKLPSKAYDIKFKPEPSSFTDVKKIAALSDIHGQYDLFIKLLTNNKIIDNDLNWIFGNGHLVITGDVFDRGDKVLEVLWFIYNLEKDAKNKGGYVHLLMGNHEYMVLQNINDYVNPKYLATAHVMQKSHIELFDNNTVLGRWLRSKNTILKIDDNLFLHGGISKAFLTEPFKIQRINKFMRKSIDDMKVLYSEGFYDHYFGKNSPVWYRGYFYDDLAETHIDSILQEVKSNRIVVGHCSNKRVVQKYNRKIFGVDSSIKLGTYGELLFIENNKYIRGTLSGKQIRLDSSKD